MIPARPSQPLRWYFGRHVEARLKRAFTAVRVRGLDTLQRSCAAGPVIVVSNHTSWWDPMLCIWLSTRLVPVDGYAMMNARNLQELPFLGRLGGFGVDRKSPVDGYRAVKYAANLLDGAGKVVWMFPQGRERPLTEPLEFYSGAAHVAAMVPDATVLAAALRYEFAESEKPYLYVSIGTVTTQEGAESAPAPVLGARRDPNAAVAIQRASVERELSLIERAVRSEDRAEFADVLSASPSWSGRFATRLLSALTRYPDVTGGRPRGASSRHWTPEAP